MQEGRWLSEEALQIVEERIEVTNRFKGLDLVGRIPEELWTNFHNIVQEAVTKMIPKEKARRQLVV